MRTWPAVFALAAALLAIGLLPSPTARAQEQTCGKVRPDVWEALDKQAWVSVAVALSAIDDPGFDELEPSERKVVVAQQQDAVLDSMTTANFRLWYRYTQLPGLEAEISAGGAAILDCHPGVSSVYGNISGCVDSVEPACTPQGNAMIVLQCDAGLDAGKTCDAATDANHDGRVNSLDALLFLQLAAGLLPSPVQPPASAPSLP